MRESREKRANGSEGLPDVYEVGDGIRLHVLPTERFKAGMLSVSAVLPIHPQKSPLSALLLSVLRRGCEKYPTLAQVNRRLDELYGTGLTIQNSYCGDGHVIGFCAELLDESYLPSAEDGILEGVLDLICQMLCHPLLDENGCLSEKYVESEKRMQCDSIRALKNHPKAFAEERMRSLLYEGEPFGTPVYGTEEQVMAVTAEELTAHWRELLSAVRFRVFYVGNTPVDRLKSALEQTLAVEQSGRPTAEWYCPHFGRCRPPRTQTLCVEEEQPISQGQLVLGFSLDVTLRDEAQFAACMVLNELLGMSPVSKLFVNVREKLSLCYSCSSRYHAYTGALSVTCSLDNANRERAQREILTQIRELANGSFTDEEWNSAVSSLLNVYQQLGDSPAALEGFYFGRSVAALKQTPQDCCALFSRVTRRQVIAMAKRLSPEVIYFLKGTRAGKEAEEDDEEED